MRLAVIGSWLLCLNATLFAAVDAKLSSGTYLPSNRQDARGILKAAELIAKGEYSQSIRFLDQVLSAVKTDSLKRLMEISVA